MSSELESRLIFIDTSAYESKNYQFNQHALKKLRDFLESGKLHLLITEITIKEVKSHLHLKSIESARAIKKIQKDAMFLRNMPDLPCYGIFERVNSDDIYGIAIESFERFLECSGAEVVSIDQVDNSLVFEKYFNSAPPFGGVNKKSEFPDAFVLEAVNIISQSRGHRLYVISNDGDMKRYTDSSDNMIYLSKIDELLDLVVRKEAELKEPVKFADSIFKDMEGILLNNAKEIIEDSEFYSDYASELDDEVYLAKIESIIVKHKNIISVSAEYAEYEIDFEVTLVANYSVADYERSPWDPEDKEYVFVLRNEFIKRHTELFSAYVNIDYMDGIRANAELSEFDFADSAFELHDDNSEVTSYQNLDINGE